MQRVAVRGDPRLLPDRGRSGANGPAEVRPGGGKSAYSSLALVLAGTVALLAGCLFAARSILSSQEAIDYEVTRSLSLGS